MKEVVTKTTDKMLIDKLVRARQKNEYAAEDTALFCYATMTIAESVAKKNAARRVLTSMLRKRGFTQKRVHFFLRRLEKSRPGKVAGYLLKLRPYREVSRWLSDTKRRREYR